MGRKDKPDPQLVWLTLIAIGALALLGAAGEWLAGQPGIGRPGCAIARDPDCHR